MITSRRVLAVLAALAVGLACNQGPKTAPTPGTGSAKAPAPPPASATPATKNAPPVVASAPPATSQPTFPPPGARGGPPGGGPPGGGPPGRGARPSPDSTAKLRQIPLKFVADQIVGHENEPAEKVFKNIQVLKGITAKELLSKMDEFGNALSATCTTCHMGTDWADDSRPNKARARIMINMVAAINADYLTKIDPSSPPQVECMNCHHGLNSPNVALDARLQKANADAAAAAAAARGGGGGRR